MKKILAGLTLGIIVGSYTLALAATTVLPASQGGTGANSLSVAFTVSSTVFSNVVEHGFDAPATTTAWQAGTTTRHFAVTQTGTLTNIACRVFPLGAGNFLNVQFGTGSASTSMLQASSTENINAASLSLTSGGTLFIDYGTSTAPAILDLSCTWQERI